MQTTTEAHIGADKAAAGPPGHLTQPLTTCSSTAADSPQTSAPCEMQTTTESHIEADNVAAMPPEQLTQLATSPPAQASAKPKKGFLDLPPEVRNNIYSHLLGEGVQIEICLVVRGNRHDRRFWGGHAFPFQPNILATCQTIRNEAVPILYGANIFNFPTPDDISAFFLVTNRKYQHMRHITLEKIDRPDHRDSFIQLATYSFMGQMRCLEKFEFEVEAIQRFTAEDMAEDLEELAWSLWEQKAEVENVEEEEECFSTMESVVDIFCFADHSQVCYDDWVPTWDGYAEWEYHQAGESAYYKDSDASDDDDDDDDDTSSKSEEGDWNSQVRKLLLKALHARLYEREHIDDPTE